MLKVVHDGSEPNATSGSAVSSSLLDAIVRDGARQMLAAALAAEVAAYIEAHSGEVDVNGHRLVVRHGYDAEREVTTAAGAVTVRAPRVNDKRIDEATGQRCRFSSVILPAWARKSPQMAEVLPLLYLHGLSTSDFAPALGQFLGTSHGLSAATITRLTEQWKDDARAFAARSLAEVDYVYVWVDGIHLKVRLEHDKVCLLVMIGVRADGTKELVALSDGFRESSESWADLLRDPCLSGCNRRGMTAPVLAVGDGALGFWKAIRDVFPDAKEQRCWWHKIGNVLAALPKSAHRPRRRPWPRPTTPRTRRLRSRPPTPSATEYGAKWPKAVAKIVDDLDVLTAVSTTIRPSTGSTFAPTRSSRPSPPSGSAPGSPSPGSRAAGVAMALKLIESAQARWRAVNAPLLVRAGARFESGQLVERPDESGGDQQAA